MHEKLSRALTLGLAGNIFFILFSLTCFFYYDFFGREGVVVPFIEAIAYGLEVIGFICLILCIVLLCKTIRMRKWLKIGFSVYTAVELVLMIFELNSYRLGFYEPYSLALAIVHSVFSGAVCFSFLSLDPGKLPFEGVIIGTVAIIFGGMIGNILGIRIYFSILANAVAFTVLFAAVKWLLAREIIEIDCYGDKARVAEYKSTLL